MTDKPSREAERIAEAIVDDDDALNEPTIPIADKGETAVAHRADDDPAAGLSSTPRPRGDQAEQLAAADGLMDPEPEVQTLDFADGAMSTQTLTQGESVLEAAYDDRGPATHLDPDNLERPGGPSAEELIEASEAEQQPSFLDEEES